MTDDDFTDRPKKSPPRVLALVLAGVAVLALGYAVLSKAWLAASPTQMQWRENDALLRVGPFHDVGFGLRTMAICVQGDERCWPPPSLGRHKREACGCETMTNGELLERMRLQRVEAEFMLGEDPGDELKERVDAKTFEDLTFQRNQINSPGNEGGPAAQREYTIQKRVYVASDTFVTFGWITLVTTILGVLSLIVAAALVLAKKRLVLPIMPTTTALLGLAIALITACLFVAMKPGPPGYVGIGHAFGVFGAGVIAGLWSALILARLLRPQDPDLLEDAMNPEQF